MLSEKKTKDYIDGQTSSREREGTACGYNKATRKKIQILKKLCILLLSMSISWLYYLYYWFLRC